MTLSILPLAATSPQGLTEKFDTAIGAASSPVPDDEFDFVDELPFDAERRAATVILSRGDSEHILITRGDPDAVLARCSHVRVEGRIRPLTEDLVEQAREVARAHAEHGMRLLAVAASGLPAKRLRYTEDDECDLVFVGFASFLDPAKESARVAIDELGAWPVLVAFAAAVLFGLSVALTPAAGLLHLDPLPLTYLPWLAAIVLAYCACVRWIKPG